MATPLWIQASLIPGFTEHLFGWRLSTFDHYASLDAGWIDQKPEDRSLEFFVQPDFLRPLVQPIRKLKRRYDCQVDDIGSRMIRVTDGTDEFSCEVSGYGPEDFPELQSFEDLWGALWVIVARELEGLVSPRIRELYFDVSSPAVTSRIENR